MKHTLLDKDGAATLREGFGWAPKELRAALQPGQGFLDALAGLVGFLTTDSSGIADDFEHTRVTYDLMRNVGDILIQSSCDFSEPVIKLDERLAHLWYFDTDNEFAGDLSQSRSLGMRTLKAAARALRDA